MTFTPPRHRIHCGDCDTNVFDIDEDAYMVRKDVWEAAGGGKAVLCIGCLEKRLGRNLEPSDFPSDVPLNLEYFRKKKLVNRSDRLNDRMGRSAPKEKNQCEQ